MTSNVNIEQVDAYLILRAAVYHAIASGGTEAVSLMIDLRAKVSADMNYETFIVANELSTRMTSRRWPDMDSLTRQLRRVA